VGPGANETFTARPGALLVQLTDGRPRALRPVVVREVALTWSGPQYISDFPLHIYLGNPLLSPLPAIQLGSRIFSLDELPFSSDGAKQPRADGSVANSRSI
jgi:hypothetical protein